MNGMVRQLLILQFYNYDYYGETVSHFYNSITMNGMVRQ